MRRNQPRVPITRRVHDNHAPGKTSAKLTSPRKIIVAMTVLIACSSTLAISRMVKAHRSHLMIGNHNNKLEHHPPPSTFPLLTTELDSRPTTPVTKLLGDVGQSRGAGGDAKDWFQKVHAFEVEWDTWSNPPLFGSFQYSPTSSIHFPHLDLQTYYQEHKPDFGNLKGGYPSPTVTAHAKSPDSDFALLTRKGNKYLASGVRANQDRAVILSPFHHEGDWWMGLFDGHGNMGHAVSHKASLEFPRLLLERISSSGSKTNDKDKKNDHVPNQAMVMETLKQTFLDVHAGLPEVIGAGSTGISILKLGQLLYLSNVGDSEAFVASYDARGTDVEIIYTTTPHKPDSPEERQRIEATGGEVILPPFPGASARVLIPLPHNEQPGMEMALAMSRSLGDSEADHLGVIAEPTTDVLDLTELLQKELQKTQQQQAPDATTRRHYMVVVASDGLLDKVPPMEVAQHVAKSLLTIHPLSPLPALEQLILKSSDLWLRDTMGGEYRDDISIAVHKLAL
jgi:serine/threonine protein phosphatase PrpC